MAEETRDLSHYDLLTRFTLRQAARLWVGEDPEAPPEGDKRYLVVVRELALAIDAGDLQAEDFQYAIVREYLAPDPWDDSGERHRQFEFDVCWDQTTVRRTALAAWARSRGTTPAFLQRDLAALGEANSTAKESQSKPPQPQSLGAQSGSDATDRGKASSSKARRSPGLPDHLISNTDAASNVGNKPETLNKWRAVGYPPLPKAKKRGRFVVYDRAEWDAFAGRYLAGEFNKPKW